MLGEGGHKPTLALCETHTIAFRIKKLFSFEIFGRQVVGDCFDPIIFQRSIISKRQSVSSAHRNIMLWLWHSWNSRNVSTLCWCGNGKKHIGLFLLAASRSSPAPLIRSADCLFCARNKLLITLHHICFCRLQSSCMETRVTSSTKVFYEDCRDKRFVTLIRVFCNFVHVYWSDESGDCDSSDDARGAEKQREMTVELRSLVDATCHETHCVDCNTSKHFRQTNRNTSANHRTMEIPPETHERYSKNSLQGHHHNGDQAARRPHIMCSICVISLGALTTAIRLFKA